MPSRRNSKTVNGKDMSRFKIILNPIELSPEENKARLERLCKLIFPHLSIDDTCSQKRKKIKKIST